MAHDMVFHERLGQVLVVGGTPPDAEAGIRAWNGSEWSALAAGGPPTDRYHFALAYDRHRDRLMLHGGARGQGAAADLYQDTWEWDGRAWHEVSDAATGPGPLVFMRTAWDRKREVTVLFGGSNPPFQHRNATWTWDGKAWQQQTAAGK
jgi:hypothetical protein